MSLLFKSQGRNGAGKSSVLDAIWETLGGKSISKGDPVKKGETEATVEVTLAGEEILVATRKWKADGKSTIKLISKTVTEDGDERVYTLSSPQKVLDTLLETVAFDPVRLINASEKERAEILRKASGLDLSQIDAERQKVYDTRTDARRVLEAREQDVVSRRNEAPAEDPGPAESLRVLMDLQEETLQKLKKVESERDLRAEVAMELNEVGEKLKTLQARKDELDARLDGMTDMDTLTKAVEEIENERQELVKKGNGLESHNAKVNSWRLYQEAVEDEAKQKAAWEVLDKEYKSLGVRRAELIQAADMPLEGLAFSETGEVLYKGIGFDQCSQSEKLRIATVLAMSMKPGLRVIQIRDGSLLDSAARAQLARLAKEFGFQVWVERVDESGDVGIYLEEGVVVNDNR